jgi:DNA-binding FrmR family transcriptional regulator
MEKETRIKAQISALKKKLESNSNCNRYAIINKIKALRKELENVREVTAWNDYLNK